MTKVQNIKATKNEITKKRCSAYFSKHKFMMMLSDRRTDKDLRDNLVAAYKAADDLHDILKKAEKNLDELEAVEIELAKVEAEIVTAVAIENLETKTGNMCLSDANGNVDKDAEVFSMY